MGSFGEFGGHIAGLVAFGMLLQEVGEEEQLQHDENDKQLDEDDGPQRLTQVHGAETLIVKVENTIEKAVSSHWHCIFLWQIYSNYLKVPNVLSFFFVNPKKMSNFARFLNRYMNKKVLIPLIIVLLALLGGVAWLFVSLQEQKQVNQDMQELAALDKQEMENEYERFALQYSEMKTQINNDSIIAQLTQEQMKTQQLLEELKQVKASDAREIARLKKELATVRAVLRDYVMQIDSLNRLNESLKQENTTVKAELEQRNAQVAGLSHEKASLSEKVAIAAQLDATNILLQILDKRGKVAKKLKDCQQMKVNFTISKNVTASNGNRTIYVRIQNPGGNTLAGGGSFGYENRTLECSAKKTIEYTGEETPVTVYWNMTQFLEAGDYRVSIFADGNMIGSRTFSFK